MFVSDQIGGWLLVVSLEYILIPGDPSRGRRSRSDKWSGHGRYFVLLLLLLLLLLSLLFLLLILRHSPLPPSACHPLLPTAVLFLLLPLLLLLLLIHLLLLLVLLPPSFASQTNPATTFSTSADTLTRTRNFRPLSSSSPAITLRTVSSEYVFSPVPAHSAT